MKSTENTENTETKTENPDNGKVRVLTKEENYFYNGVTIDGGDVDGNQTYQTGDYMKNIRIGNFSFNSDSVVTKIVLGLVITGVIFFLLFVALPIALVVLGVLVTVWLILSFFQKR